MDQLLVAQHFCAGSVSVSVWLSRLLLRYRFR